MRVLITNNSLSARAGTELVVYEIGRELRRRGHEVAAYSSTLGEVAELMVGSSLPVGNRPEACPFQPDIIHGQHHLDAMTALLAFPDTPAVYHTHRGVPWVDLNRFRGNHLPPARPESAVLFGGGLGDPAMVAKLRPAFETVGIRLDSTADWTETDRRTPELALPRYDIALASGRSALEAMASGCAVIIANHASSTGWVRPENFESGPLPPTKQGKPPVCLLHAAVCQSTSGYNSLRRRKLNRLSAVFAGTSCQPATAETRFRQTTMRPPFVRFAPLPATW